VPKVSELARARRLATTASIDLNPTTVVVTRIKRTKKGGGFEEKDSVLSPQRVRIYQTSKTIVEDTLEQTGNVRRAQGWGMLLSWNGNVEVDEYTKDSFNVVGLGHFQVRRVNPQFVDRICVGIQCELYKEES